MATRTLVRAFSFAVNVTDETTVGAIPVEFGRRVAYRTSTQRLVTALKRCTETALPANESAARTRTVNRRGATLPSEIAGRTRTATCELVWFRLRAWYDVFFSGLIVETYAPPL